MEILIWLDGGNPRILGNLSSTYGGPQRLTPTRSSSKPAPRRLPGSSVRWSAVSSISIFLQRMESPMMNKYALTAQAHWKMHAPARYAALENPEEFFQQMGESAAQQIERVASTLEQTVPADLPYLDKVGQYQAIRLQVEELVLSDLVYSVESESTTMVDELEGMLGDLPSPSAIQTAIDRLYEEADEEAEREGSSTSSMTSEQASRLAQLQALLPLVSLPQEPEEMSEAAARDLILALRPFWNPETRGLAAL